MKDVVYPLKEWDRLWLFIMQQPFSMSALVWSLSHWPTCRNKAQKQHFPSRNVRSASASPVGATGNDASWLVRCRSASDHRHVEGQTSQGRIHSCPHSPCANRAKARWAPSPSNGLPAINNPSFCHTADQTKFSALIHAPLCAFSAQNLCSCPFMCQICAEKWL